MNQLEMNIVNSFRKAKTDILKLESQVVELSQKQEKLMEIILEEKDKNSKLYQRVKSLKSEKKPKVITKTKVITKNGHKDFVASKEGKKFHIVECPFAKNIKPKSKVVFKSKTKALNEGYKPCTCVTK